MVLVVSTAVVVTSGLAVPAFSAPAKPVGRSGPVVWSPPAAVNRRSVGSTPTGGWSPTVRQTAGSASTTATSPAATQVASSSLGVSPNTVAGGSGAAGAGLGVQAFYGLESFPLDSINQASAQVNVANGNLVLHSLDLKINGPGLSLRLDRFYNSRSTGSGAFGVGGVLSTGRDVGVQVGSSSVTFTGPSGFTAVFTGTGPSYTAPAGINADLVKQADGTYTLTYRKSGEKLSFTSGGFLTSDADRNGVAIQLAYDSSNMLSSITDTAGRVTTVGYDPAHPGSINSTTDPAGRHTLYLYDASGNLTQVTDPNSGVTKYSYTGGRISGIQTAGNAFTDIGYDSLGRVSSVTRWTTRGQASGPSSVFGFGYATGSSTETNPLGQTTTYTLDSSSRVTRVSDPLGHARSRTWTANSDVATAVDAMGTGSTGSNVTTYSYDSVNNVTAVALPTGAAGTAQYGAATGCATTDTTHPYLAKCASDAQGDQTSATYDTVGNVTRTQDTTGAKTGGVARVYTYQGTAGASCGGKTGQRCSVTDGNGHVTRYAYGANGELTSTTPPAPLSATTYGYDSLSRLTSVTDGRGITTSYSYDSRDQLTKALYSGGGGEVDYGYDADGNPTSRTDTGYGTQTYTYDGQGRQTATTLPGVAAAIGTGYDAAGNITTYTDANGTVGYGYDAANNLTSLTEPSGAITTFGYNANNARTSTTYPGATVQTTTVDNSGRPTRIRAVHSSTVLSDLSYRWSTATGKDSTVLQARTDTVGIGAPAGSVTTYGYDSLARLTSATEKTAAGAASYAWTYGYDNTGNRTTASTQSGTSTPASTSYTYNTADQLSTINGAASGLAYDGDGNELGGPSRSNETYNPRNQLTSLTTAAATIAFGYAGLNNTERTTADGASYLNGPLGVSAETSTTGGDTAYTRTPAGQLISTRTGTGSNYYLTDNLGSVVGEVDATGTKTAAYAYDPYGRSRTISGPAATSNPWRYTSGYTDTSTGLTKLGARYYDPTTGRFTQPDPSGQETNIYRYAGDNPVNNTDTTGLNIDFTLAPADLNEIGIALATGTGIAAAIQAATGVGAPTAILTAVLGGISSAVFLSLGNYGCSISVHIDTFFDVPYGGSLNTQCGG
jgi:RHS repeat-associated protein